MKLKSNEVIKIAQFFTALQAEVATMAEFVESVEDIDALYNSIIEHGYCTVKRSLCIPKFLKSDCYDKERKKHQYCGKCPFKMIGNFAENPNGYVRDSGSRCVLDILRFNELREEINKYFDDDTTETCEFDKRTKLVSRTKLVYEFLSSVYSHGKKN